MTAFRPSPLGVAFLMCASAAFAGGYSGAIAVDPVATTTVEPYGDQREAHLAQFDGGVFLVWTDGRTGGIWDDVRGLRLGFDGGKLGPDFLIAGGPLTQTRGTVGCAPDICLAVWRNGANLEAARFLADGTRLDSPPLIVATFTTAPTDVTSIAVASDGVDFLVAWTRDYSVEVQLVTKAGALSGSMASLLRVGSMTSLSAASDGNGWELAWSEETPTAQYNTRCVKFTPPSTFSAGPQILTTSTYSTNARVSAAGPDGGYMVVWHTATSSTQTGYVLAKGLYSDGIQNGGTLTLTPTNTALGEPAIAFDGDSWQVVYRDPLGALEHRLLGQDGGVLAPTPLSVTGTAPQLALSDANKGLLVWGDTRTSSPIFRHGVLSGGAIAPPGGTATLRAGNNQTNPAVAHGAGGFFYVWEDDRSAIRQLWGVTISDSGQLGTPIALSPTLSNDQLNPVVAFDGSVFVVVWQEGSAVRALRVATNGAVLGPSVQLATASASKPALAVGQNETYVLWSAVAAANEDLKVMRIARDGGLVDPVDRGLMTTPGENERNPSAVFTSDGLCVGYTTTGAPAGLRMNCFDSSLQPRFDGGVRLTSNSSDFEVKLANAPRIWAVFTNGFGSDAVSAVELALDAGTRGPFPVVPAATIFNGVFQAAPAVAFDGEGPAIVHERVTADGGTDVFLRRIGLDGGIVELSEVAASAEEERFPAVTEATSGRLGIAYSAFDPATQRLQAYFRTWGHVRAGGVCAATDECVGGLPCVSNTCGGSADAGSGDGGTSAGNDGGADSGTGVADGGSSQDGGTSSVEPGRYDVGCGCEEAPALAWLAGLAIAAVVRMRRRRR